jgi:hypothetical protein
MLRLCVFFLLGFLFSVDSGAQIMSGNDSLVLRSYWNKISIRATGSKGDYLYNGIDNDLSIVCPDSISSHFKLFLSANNGKIIKSDNGYSTIPKNAGRSFVTTYYINDTNDTIVIGKKQFIVLALPYPSLIIGKNMITEKATIDRSVFFTSDSLKLFYTSDYPESDYWFKIEHFIIGYSYGGNYISAENEGPKLTPKTLDFIKRLAPGQEIVIKVNSISPLRITSYLPLVRFKIL